MSNLENKFKTASIGGFVKKDVVDYIDSMTLEYHTKLSTLEKIVAAAQAARGDLEQRIQLAEAARNKLLGENERLQSMIVSFQEQFSKVESELTGALAEVERLKNEHITSSILEGQLQAASQEIEGLQRREAEFQKQLAARSAELDGTHQAELTQLQEQLSAQQAFTLQLQEKNAELAQELEKASTGSIAAPVSSALLLELQTQLEQRNRQIIQINAELELMQEKCKNYENTVSALEEMQSKAAQIETQAHEKASTLIATAAQESEKVKTDLSQWLSEVESSYNKMKLDAEQKIAQAYEELEKTKAAMDKLSSEQEPAENRPMQQPFVVLKSRYGDAKNA